MEHKEISLVLSGGGARGIAHIGVIEVLLEKGYKIGAISGTSMGSLVAGVYASNKMEDFKQWLFGLDKLKVFNLVDFTLSSQGLVKGDKVLNAMKTFIPDTNIEDLAIPYTAVATDIINNKEVVFDKGSLYEAIRASISIPTVLTPVQQNGSLLVDGGLVNNLPINRVKRNTGDVLFAVNVNAEIPVNKPIVSKKEEADKESVYRQKLKRFYDQLQKIRPQQKEEKLSYLDLMDKTINVMMDKITQQHLAIDQPDLLFNISRETCSTFDFYKAEDLVAIGRYVAEETLKEITKVDPMSF